MIFSTLVLNILFLGNDKMRRLLIKKLPVWILAILLVCALTFVIFSMRENYFITNRDRIIFLAYQTNISGSSGEIWAKNLQALFPEMPGFEVSVYFTHQTGNETITITTENGWQQIITRLGNKQGDILLLNNTAFYDTMLKNDFLLPLEPCGYGDRALRGTDGNIYGIDITGLTAEGLYRLNSSQADQNELLSFSSADTSSYETENEEIPPRVIAVLYKGTSHEALARQVIERLFGGCGQ